MTLPDLLTDLQDKTQLTRRTIVRILTESGRLNDFKRNPQQFIELVGEAINRAKRLAIVDGIKYQRIGDDYYYAQELFEQEELTGYLEKHAHRYAEIGIRACGVRFGHGSRTLPRNWRTTKRSRYTPNFPAGSKCRHRWAPIIPTGRCWWRWMEPNAFTSLWKRKAACFSDDLRERESAKITCGEAHFKALERGDNPARFIKASTVEDVLISTGG